MSLSAAVIRELVAAGLSGDELIAACERIDAASEAALKPERSAGAARTARWRERKASQSVTKRHGDVTSVTSAPLPLGSVSPAPPSSPNPTPPKSPPMGGQKGSVTTTPRQALLAVLTDEWAGAVLDHRQKIRKPLTAKAAELLAKAFDATGDPNGAAQMMIERGWQGFKLEWWQNDRNKPQNNRTSGGDAKLDALRFGLDGGDVFGNLDRGSPVFSPGKPDPERSAAPGFGQPSIDLERQPDGKWSAPGVH